MIKTLKKKVIFTSMIAITILLEVLLGAVNVVNAWSNHQETENLLEFLSRLETSGDRPDWMHDGSENGPPPLPEGETRDPEEDQAPPIGEKRDSFDGGKGRGFMAEPLTENDWRAAVYFTVRVRDGSVSDVDLTRISSVSESEAVRYGEQALAKGASGSLDSFRYTTAEAEDGSKVIVFLENSSRRNAVLRVAALSALAGIAGWGLMLLLVVLLSKKAVAPIAANMERQRQFVTDAGHELKTPIAIIRANTEAMELISGKTKWSKNIADQVTRLSDLTQNLLTLARADGAPRAGSLEPVDFTAIVEDTARMFQEPMALRGLGLEARVAGNCLLKGNRDQLSTLVSILFDNAVKYAAGDSTLLLRLEQEEKKLLLQLENDCDRLPDCPPDQLFDRFYRGDAARTQTSGGFGIGLSAARVIVQQHRGRITAAYQGQHRIVFTVTLPV